MNKKIALLAMLPLIMIGGCNTSSEITPSSSSSSTSVSESYRWSKEIDEVLTSSLGQYFDELPVFEDRGELVKCESGLNESGTVTSLVSFQIDFDPKLATMYYRTTLMENGFDVIYVDSSDIYQSYKSVSLEYSLICNYYSYKQTATKNIFMFSAFLYKDKSTTWPTSDVVSVLNTDIPHIDAPFYVSQVGSQSGIDYVQVLCFGLTDESETTYMGILKEAGYIVRTNSSACNAVHHENGINLDFYYDFEQEFLLIQGYLLSNDMLWPSAWLEELLHEDTLPVYSDPAVTYAHGDDYVLDNSGNTFKVVEVQYAPASSFAVYCDMLVSDGWTKEGEDDDLPENWPLFPSFEAFALFNKGSHRIEVRYYDPSDPALAFYENLIYPVLLIIIYK